MKKQKSKSMICRKKSHKELNTDNEHKEKINALAIQFKEDKLKALLRRCYSNVQKYGSEAILKAVEDSWTANMAVGCSGISSLTDDRTFVQIADDVCKNQMKNLEVDTQQRYGTSHDHEITSKKNALFLIESSESLDDYDLSSLTEMKTAYKNGNYDDVADLAYLQDCRRRPGPQPPERRIDDSTTFYREKPKSPWQRISELLTEVVEEDQSESPLKCCVEAVRYLSRDLTYDNVGAAKESIRKAIEGLDV